MQSEKKSITIFMMQENEDNVRSYEAMTVLFNNIFSNYLIKTSIF